MFVLNTRGVLDDDAQSIQNFDLFLHPHCLDSRIGRDGRNYRKSTHDGACDRLGWRFGCTILRW